MKNCLRLMFAALAIPSIIIFSCFSGAPLDTVESTDLMPAVESVKPVTDQSREARFQHMLSLSSAFGIDFDNDAALVESAQLALNDYKTEIDGSEFIHKALVTSFIKNLYGKDIDAADFADVMPAPDGYMSIPAKGFSYIYHNIISVTDNGDDTFTVISAMQVLSHDGEASDALVSSVFGVNDDSSFGYNLIFSEIL